MDSLIVFPASGTIRYRLSLRPLRFRGALGSVVDLLEVSGVLSAISCNRCYQLWMQALVVLATVNLIFCTEIRAVSSQVIDRYRLPLYLSRAQTGQVSNGSQSGNLIRSITVSSEK